MLKFNPGHRLTTFAALRHDYFDGHISGVAYAGTSTTPQMSQFGLVEHGQIASRQKGSNSSSPDLCVKMRGL
jgi:hypothetical protein